MTDQKLEKLRDELEKKWERMFAAHSAKYNKHIAREEEYRESARNLRNLYEEWSKVAKELGHPLPEWF